MKNKKRLIRKNRTILYITIALALVSLMSVGFSNYIIGLVNKTKEITTNISTETITYKTLILEANTNITSIKADRNNSSTTGGSTTNESIRSPYTFSKYRNDVSLLKEGNNTTSLVVTIPFNIDIIASYKEGDSSVKDLRPDSLDVSYKIIDSTNTNTNLNEISVSKSRFRTDGSYNLFDFNVQEFVNNTYKFNKDTDFKPYAPSSESTITGSYYHYSKIINIDIKYGNFFNGELPDDFYNKKLDEIKNQYLANTKTRDYLLESIDQAYNELLESFYQKINNKTIVFTFKVNKEGITT